MSDIRELLVNDGHCPVGEYRHQIPMAINGRLQSIDYCVSDIVAALNACNITTSWSCCGHGKMDACIGLEDGRILTITREAVTPDE